MSGSAADTRRGRQGGDEGSGPGVVLLLNDDRLVSRRSAVFSEHAGVPPLGVERSGLALHALYVEVDRKQILDIEGMHRQARVLQVLVANDLHPVVLLRVALAFLEEVIDLFSAVLQEPQVVVAGCGYWLVAFGQEDELVRIGQEEVTQLTHDLGVGPLPTED